MGYILAIVIGVVLGLIGGGGSILAVPILVYILGVNPIQATAYSLFIVGLSALIGARKHYQLGNINFKIGILFAAPSFIGVFLSRKWLLPAIPHKLLELNSFILFKDSFLMILFAILMLFAAYSMLSRKVLNQKPIIQINILKITLDGFIVGIVTGLVGAGGGFLIVPALILFSGLEMKKAIGTSLMIIAIKSLFGFLGAWQSSIDWSILFPFTALSISGIFLGIYLGKSLNGHALKKSFAIFVLLMSITIIFVEVF
jgi:uncharacterized membrane protein YfcA